MATKIEDVLREIRDTAKEIADADIPGFGNRCTSWAEAIEAAMREPVAVSPKFACLEWIPTANLPSPGTKLFAFPPDAAGEIESLNKSLLVHMEGYLDAQAEIENLKAELELAESLARAALNEEAKE